MEWEKQKKEFLSRKKTLYSFPEQYRIEPFRIIANLYFVGNQDAAVYLLDTEEGILLFDTGYPVTTGLLIYSITKLGFKIENIRKILHTHGHFDHIGATAILRELSGTVTYLGIRDINMFYDKPELSLKELAGNPYFQLFVPDEAVLDGDIITLGSSTISAVATPGHSDGTMSYFFDVYENGEKYRCGLMGGSGLNTLSKAFIDVFERKHARAEFLDSLNRIYEKPVDINLGNHTPQNRTLEKRSKMLSIQKSDPNPKSIAACNPFIDSSEWKRFLDQVREQYDRMLQYERKNR